MKTNTKASEFKLPNQEGKIVSLKDFEGKKVILYFYPKDMTPGCTLEAKDFSCMIKEFKKLNVEVIGVSKDNVKSHEKFIQKEDLKINLLSDIDHKVQEKFGVWQKKKFMGREFMGTVRSTFLIGERGNIEKEWNNVKSKGHVEEVLNYIKNGK